MIPDDRESRSRSGDGDVDDIGVAGVADEELGHAVGNDGREDHDVALGALDPCAVSTVTTPTGRGIAGRRGLGVGPPGRGRG